MSAPPDERRGRPPDDGPEPPVRPSDGSLTEDGTSADCAATVLERNGQMTMTMQTVRVRLGRLVVAGGALGVIAGAGFASPAAAADVEREKHGSCTGSSRWELQLEREHGRIEIDLDVDTPRSGQTWVVKLKHDGDVFTIPLDPARARVLGAAANDADLGWLSALVVERRIRGELTFGRRGTYLVP